MFTCFFKALYKLHMWRCSRCNTTWPAIEKKTECAALRETYILGETVTKLLSLQTLHLFLRLMPLSSLPPRAVCTLSYIVYFLLSGWGGALSAHICVRARLFYRCSQLYLPICHRLQSVCVLFMCPLLPSESVCLYTHTHSHARTHTFTYIYIHAYTVRSAVVYCKYSSVE